MKKLLAAATATLCIIANTSHAEYVNDFHCTLNKGVTVPQLLQFQQQWMEAAGAKGFDASYKTRVLFPIYNEKTSTEPMFFVWRGFFRDGEQFGKMLDWFPSSKWAVKFQQIMNCEKSSLWKAPK